MLPELRRSGVYVKRYDHVLAIIRNMINNGNQRMQASWNDLLASIQSCRFEPTAVSKECHFLYAEVVADFDMTLTRFTDAQGKPCDTCFRSLESSKLLSSAFNEQAMQLKNHYYAIEVHPTMSVAEKIPHMVEWWTKSHDLLLKLNLKESLIKQIVSDSRIQFRDGCDWLFQELHKHDVPLLILSAGIGDVILETIRQRAILYNNIKVVSNFMEFDDEGVLKGFKGNLMHVFNKNENAVHKSEYFENLAHRDSILLLGDSLGDLQMADGAPESANLLTVGFLNEKAEERLPKYMDSFDIVLVDDQSMEIPNAIVRQVLEGSDLRQDSINDEKS